MCPWCQGFIGFFEEAEIPALEVARPDDVGQPEEVPIDAFDEEPSVDEQEELRIVVRFLSYQMAPRMWTAWYQRGEGLASLLRRIEILCGTAASRTTIAPADLQVENALTIVSCPMWWGQVGRSPVLMVPGHGCDGHGDFVQVADRELRAVDLVPDQFFIHRRRLDVYATFDDPPVGGIALLPPDRDPVYASRAKGLTGLSGRVLRRFFVAFRMCRLPRLPQTCGFRRIIWSWCWVFVLNTRL